MKIRLTYLCIAALALTLSACDEVDEGERFEPVDFVAQKNVLVEDFTGQRCINCPLAAEALVSIQELYGSDHVIAVSIHGGDFAVSTPPNGLATPTGEEYVSNWSVESFPSGLIDRVGGLREFTSWSAGVITRLQMEPAVNIEVENAYDPANRELSINVSATGNQDASGKLSVWLVESNIVAPQIMPNGEYNLQYVHNHVFRTSVNGTWGEDVAVAEGETETKSYSVTLDAAWKAENMAVVAFVSNDSEGVLQVVDKAIVANNETQE